MGYLYHSVLYGSFAKSEKISVVVDAHQQYKNTTPELNKTLRNTDDILESIDLVAWNKNDRIQDDWIIIFFFQKLSLPK